MGNGNKLVGGLLVMCSAMEPRKKFLMFFIGTMANSPNPDRAESLMQEQFGTRVLITDLAADKYLEQSSKHGNERYRKWCGGTSGWDDYCERMH